MNILTFSTLYPNAVQPHFGVFVENRLRHLVDAGSVGAQVVAPVPWFPLRAKAFGRYARFAGVPAEEQRFGIRILHPRYPLVPKLGMSLAPFLMYVAMRPVIRNIIRSGFAFDLIDAHYFYPDGVAAAMLGRRFGKPVTITARGTDLNLIPRHRVPRRLIRWAADQAAGLVTVCEALKTELVALGVAPSRVRVLRNGVDLELFTPVDRAAARRRLGLEGPILLSVGHLIPRKGHDIVIRALLELPAATLLIAGDGPEEASLEALVRALGLEGRVRFLGAVAHERMHRVYGAADVLVLASDREGWPNVLLEAMACGTPVVATKVWGTPEVVTSPVAGRLVAERSPAALAEGIRTLLANPPERAETRAYAERFGWQETTQGQLELFRQILDQRAAR
jgi:glycosyltransferase involved in cell wall biosynthesis